MKKIVALSASLMMATLCWAEPGAKVDFPKDYRSSFTPYLSLNRTQNPDQYIRLFINDKGLSGTQVDGSDARPWMKRTSSLSRRIGWKV